MSQDETIIAMARQAGFLVDNSLFRESISLFERFAAIVAAHAKSEQIQTAYQQGCEDMKRRIEKRMQQLDSQLQLCQTAVLAEREACAKVCEEMWAGGYGPSAITAAIRARNNKE